MADPADVRDRAGLHAAIDRLYDSLDLMGQASVLELSDGRTFDRTWRVTSDLSMPTTDAPIEVAGESMTQCDPIARYILACTESGHSLAHQRQMQKTLRDEAEKAYIARYGKWTDASGAPARRKGRDVL